MGQKVSCEAHPSDDEDIAYATRSPSFFSDYRSTLLGFKFGGVPSINSLNSLLQFQVRALLFAITRPHADDFQLITPHASEQLIFITNDF